jgi:moderate conductance mechanosensitive channel
MPTFMRAIGAATLALVLLLGAAGAGAQTAATSPATPPAGMTQDQFNSLVDAISNSVTEKLKA